MSRIDELVERLCPDGVEYKPLGVIAELKRGQSITRKSISSGSIPVVAGGREIAYFCGDSNREGETIVIAGSGAYAGHVSWWSRPIFVSDSFSIKVSEELVSMRFCYYWLTSQQEILYRLKRGGGVPHVYPRDVSSLMMPVPPLEVQTEIVRILDCFTSLEAELEARRRQFDHYRQLLIQRLNVAHESLGSLGTWIGGMTPSKSNRAFWESGSIPWLASMDVAEGGVSKIRGRITELAMKENPLKIVSAPAIVVVMRSNILRRRLPIGLVDVDTTVNQDVKALIPRDGLDVEYISQVLISMSEDIRSRSVRTDGSMAALDSRSFYSCSIPVPSLREQEAVSARLRSFGEITSDLSAGLPAEIAARRQQYEYYRDRLLTFKEKAS